MMVVAMAGVAAQPQYRHEGGGDGGLLGRSTDMMVVVMAWHCSSTATTMSPW